MNKINDMGEIKRLELNALLAIDGFCRSNGINYYLYFGSLLGAIRHNGFIPWDDDIDIAMKREDYSRFLATFKDDRYKIATYENKKGYIYPFAKVYDNLTLLDEDMLLKCELGVGVDVFPIDGIENDEKAFKRRVSKITFYKYIISGKLFWLNGTTALKRLIIRFVSALYSGKSVAKKINRIASSVSLDSADKAGVMVFGNPSINIMEKKYFNETIEVEFEGYKFLAPKNYHEILTNNFGDYMSPPPVNSRVSNHHFSVWYK